MTGSGSRLSGCCRQSTSEQRPPPFPLASLPPSVRHLVIAHCSYEAAIAGQLGPAGQLRLHNCLLSQLSVSAPSLELLCSGILIQHHSGCCVQVDYIRGRGVHSLQSGHSNEALGTELEV